MFFNVILEVLGVGDQKMQAHMCNIYASSNSKLNSFYYQSVDPY